MGTSSARSVYCRILYSTSLTVTVLIVFLQVMAVDLKYIVVPITVIENTDWIVLAIFLTIFRYDPGAIGAASIHVNSDGHPARQHFSLTIFVRGQT